MGYHYKISSIMVEAGIDTIGSVQKQIDSLKEEMNEEASLIGESIGSATFKTLAGGFLFYHPDLAAKFLRAEGDPFWNTVLFIGSVAVGTALIGAGIADVVHTAGHFLNYQGLRREITTLRSAITRKLITDISPQEKSPIN